MKGQSNFLMWRETVKHYKEHESEIVCGILDKRELSVILTNFNIGDRTSLDLQNLRDFVVAVSDRDTRNIMSAITHVIDSVKFDNESPLTSI